MLLQTVSNHPVHVLNNEGDFSPSSFIPFCSFGEELLGTKIDDFEIPVCNIFKPTNYLDQLCYETNLNEFKDSNSKNQLEMGLTLILDYNEERQHYKISEKNEPHLMKAFYRYNNDFSIFLDTISLSIFHKVSLLIFTF